MALHEITIAIRVFPYGPGLDLLARHGDTITVNEEDYARALRFGAIVGEGIPVDPPPEPAGTAGIDWVETDDDLAPVGGISGHPIVLVIEDSEAGGEATLRYFDDLAWNIIQGGATEGVRSVATVDDLPDVVGPGTFPVYLVIGTATPPRPTLYAWNGTIFTAVGGSSGGGGVGPGGLAVRNLFIQETRPADIDVIIDSLWINTDSGLPADIDTWQVFTGRGDGDGGNLILSVDEPTPSVDALWIPLDNTTGNALPYPEWVVFGGRGSQLGVGNDNLYISSTIPAGPAPGSMWIPLTTAQEARPMDLWRINT
jgi:hypothetical protein